MHHHFLNLDFFAGGLFWTLASYAAQTFPMPGNKYAKWFLGIIQYALANKSLGNQNFAAAKKENAIDNLSQSIEQVYQAKVEEKKNVL